MTTMTDAQRNGCWAMVYTLAFIPLDSFTIWLYWLWFVVPFHVNAISYWHAFGLSIFISYMIQTALYAPLDVEKQAEQITKHHFKVLFSSLILAVLAHLLMH